MHCLQVAVGTFRSTETFEKLAFEYRGFSLLLAERFLAARSKEKRLYSRAIEKLETVANVTEISPNSFLTFWKLLNFRNANLSTEDSSNSRSKVEWKENFRENSFENLGIAFEVDLCFGNFGKCCSIR